MKKLFFLLLTLLFSVQLLSPVVLADDDDDEIKGVITSISGDTISFTTKYGEEMTVTLNNNIRFKKKVNGDIAPGMRIEVEYRNGNIKEIEIEGAKTTTDSKKYEKQEEEIKGVITSVSGDKISFITRNGEEKTVQLTNDIRLKKKVNGDITPGMKIEVEYRNGTIKEIEIEHSKNQQVYTTVQSGNDNSWLTWKRTNEKNPSATLPFNEQTTISVQVNDQQPKSITMIPINGQAFVPVSELSPLLDATVTFHENIGIAEVTKQNKELLFKIQSNVVYENMNKTPIEEAPFILENKLYLPINALANGLGYELTWDAQTKSLLMKG